MEHKSQARHLRFDLSATEADWQPKHPCKNHAAFESVPDLDICVICVKEERDRQAAEIRSDAEWLFDTGLEQDGAETGISQPTIW